ncbi:hypothetical protein LOCC1_G003783 [Lachnellula occidentalis]|uniref:Uncharacterized protein n=1 Tax=Lachnellula occidentalis TaxID=215460 RepID=A0A8H8RZ10_9HELO|nr:hypothetical protein LOCC1_G003783 [Lachnellula occidentalis]
MHSPVTECAIITLKPGVDLETSGTDSAQAWSETLSTVSKQTGYQRSYWGRQLENPNIVLLLIGTFPLPTTSTTSTYDTNWASLSAHQAFMNSPSYQPFTARLLPLTENIHLHHFTPSVFPPSVIGSAPVIEFATFYDIQPAVIVGNTRKFQGVLDEAAERGEVPAYLGGVWGEVIEDIAKGGAEAGKGRALRLCLGWTSKEEHMKFRETQLFKDNVALLREGVGSAEVHHVAFKAT